MNKLLKNINPEDLKKLMVDHGFQAYRVDQIFSYIYKKRIRDFQEMLLLPREIRDFLDKEFELEVFQSNTIRRSEDGSVKFLFKLRDNLSIESVYIPADNESDDDNSRKTLCVSTMAGCPVNCSFCATATLGYKRNLDTAEIIEQVLKSEEILNLKFSNIVFMGMGEPFLNIENVNSAINILSNQTYDLINSKKITLSTIGIPDRIIKYADSPNPVKIAVSLHATTNGQRAMIIPLAKSHSLTKLFDSLEYFYQKTHLPITYEYIVFDDFNNTELDAKRLAKFCSRFPSKVNLIPFNDISFTNPKPKEVELKAASKEKIEEFAALLRQYGAKVFIRDTFGKDIEAACGQLALSSEKLLK
ncbi:MAG: 23S rRNA (adenine(2503)-C(2))-methyltransferase RlmN [Candidatus Kapabacteria bacterium]|nr:23S rRNA (adenine(2503)-C(2))-methyltransferase RlmN [Candidatus Kapabacteria bacterium]